MTNEQKIFKLFYEQHPEFEDIKEHLRQNLYSDILDVRKAEGERVIAVSDIPHNLMLVGEKIPTKWTIK